MRRDSLDRREGQAAERVTLPLRGSRAVLVVDGPSLAVESPAHERFPVDLGVLTLTSRCNLACTMCLEPREPGPPDLPLAEALAFAQLFGGRVPRVWTCAGEALLYPWFTEVGRAIAERGTRLGVGTNGLVLDDPLRLSECAQAAVRWLHVSCHTSRPERFAAITSAANPRVFDRFVHALRNIDDWNRGHPEERRFEVLLQLVLMKPFLDELDEYLEFVSEHLPHSHPTIRVEPMQLVNAGRDHPERLYDLAELARLVRELIDRRPPGLSLEFKSIPLCMLEGAEGLSEDLRTRAAGTVVVGNVGRQSGALSLQCPIGDPARSAFAHRCADCSLRCLCPGVMNNPVPDGSPWPRPSRAPAAELLAHLGLRTDFADRSFSLEFPIDARGSTQDPAGPSEEDLEGTARQLGVDLASSGRFSRVELDRVGGLARLLEQDGVLARAHISDRFAALRLRATGAGDGTSTVIIEPGRSSAGFYFATGGVAVRYEGPLTVELRRQLERIRRALAGT